MLERSNVYHPVWGKKIKQTRSCDRTVLNFDISSTQAFLSTLLDHQMVILYVPKYLAWNSKNQQFQRNTLLACCVLLLAFRNQLLNLVSATSSRKLLLRRRNRKRETFSSNEHDAHILLLKYNEGTIYIFLGPSLTSRFSALSHYWVPIEQPSS